VFETLFKHLFVDLGCHLGLPWVSFGLWEVHPTGVSEFFHSYISRSSGRRELYRFSADLAKLALRIAERHGSSGEKWFVPFITTAPNQTDGEPVELKSFFVPWFLVSTICTFEQTFLVWSKP
jgi:hypothetical protein